MYIYLSYLLESVRHNYNYMRDAVLKCNLNYVDVVIIDTVLII
jgi:hypothetical protein